MSINRRKVIASSIGAGIALATTGIHAQSAWPAKPIRIVVPYPPGGSSDIIARAISQPLSDALKQPVIVDNKAGANGNLGADLVAKSAPDGYTLLLCDTGALAISPSVYTKLPFNPARDLRGVTMLAYSPHLLVVHPSVPANNLKELVALSQQKPLSFAVTAIGSAPHLAGVAVEKATKAEWTYIPYKGGSQAIGDTVAGQTQVLMNGMLATLPMVQSGKLKVLGVSKATRVPLLAKVNRPAINAVINLVCSRRMLMVAFLGRVNEFYASFGLSRLKYKMFIFLNYPILYICSIANWRVWKSWRNPR